MKLAREELLRRFGAKDENHDGTFVVGVVTTGIYCLPSCRARKPRDENVRFFHDEEEARAAGLRACKRCRPDHFYRNFDPDRERVADLAARIRERPGAFGDARALCDEAGVGATKLTELFRRHYHTTPAAYLLRARLAAAARELVETKRRVLDVALDAGFESSSAFHGNFRRAYRLAPGAYRRLGEGAELTLELPADFRRDDVLAMFGRDPEGRTERVTGRAGAKAVSLGGRPARLELRFGARELRVAVRSSGCLGRRALVDAHALTLRLLGLLTDPGPFERRVARTRGLSRLVRGRRGLRIPLTADVFEGLLWVIVGQQVNLRFASQCRDTVVRLAGEPAGDGFFVHPTPRAVAELDYVDLTKRKFTRRKSEYLVDAARRIRSGELDLEDLDHAPVREIVERLSGVRGLGPWSIQYLLMRSYGREDCVPVGDAGLTAALQRFFDLAERPGPEETLRLMEPFAPHRSLATFHLWKTLGESPGGDA